MNAKNNEIQSRNINQMITYRITQNILIPYVITKDFASDLLTNLFRDHPRTSMPTAYLHWPGS
jgi:hypothetical protein